MKLSAVLNDAAYQAADDSLKTFYVQNTETKDWWLDVDEPGKLDVSGSKTLQNKKDELKRVHDDKKAVTDELAGYKALGKSAEELKAALEANQPENVTKLIADHQAELKTLRESYEQPLAVLKTENETLKADQERVAVAAIVQKLCREFDLDSEYAEFVLPNYLKAVRSEDSLTVKVFENGTEAMIAGQPKSFEQLVRGFREEKKHSKMFNVGTADGPGNLNRTTNTGLNKQLEGLSAVERLKVARQNGATT